MTQGAGEGKVGDGWLGGKGAGVLEAEAEAPCPQCIEFKDRGLMFIGFKVRGLSFIGFKVRDLRFIGFKVYRV